MRTIYCLKCARSDHTICAHYDHPKCAQSHIHGFLVRQEGDSRQELYCLHICIVNGKYRFLVHGRTNQKGLSENSIWVCPFSSSTAAAHSRQKMEVQKLQTNSGKEAICVAGHVLRKYRESKVANTWRCTKKTCTATCKTNKLDTFVTAFGPPHNHEENDPKDLAVKKLRIDCKKRAAEDLFERPIKFIRQELQHHTNEPDIHAKDVEYVRKAMYYERRKHLPKLPKSRQETQEALAAMDLKSCREEDMIHVNDVTTGIVIFSTRSNIEFLCDDNVSVLGDGTFKVCPKFFYQMYTLHGYKNGQYVPCVVCLLPSKTVHIYEVMFNQVKTVCANLNFNLDISVIHLDFEQAAHKAVRNVWPNVVLKGCHFHLLQAWWRKIQNLGLSAEYKTRDSDIGKWLKSFFGLGFLRPIEVEDCFAFDIVAGQPEDRRCARFADYILQTYVAPDAQFPPVIWANSDVACMRTTNACESFHKHFADQFYSAHPSVFAFLDKLKQLQTHTYTKIAAAAADLQAPPRRQRQQRIQNMAETKRQYENGDITRYQFVKKMAFKWLPQ